MRSWWRWGAGPTPRGWRWSAASIRYDARQVMVDEELRTSNPRVFAVGDVTATLPFTHTAGHDAAVAVRNALLPLSTRVDHRLVPWTTFTAPEVARVGLTEDEARHA